MRKVTERVIPPSNIWICFSFLESSCREVIWSECTVQRIGLLSTLTTKTRTRPMSNHKKNKQPVAYICFLVLNRFCRQQMILLEINRKLLTFICRPVVLIKDSLFPLISPSSSNCSKVSEQLLPVFCAIPWITSTASASLRWVINHLGECSILNILY